MRESEKGTLDDMKNVSCMYVYTRSHCNFSIFYELPKTMRCAQYHNNSHSLVYCLDMFLYNRNCGIQQQLERLQIRVA